MAMGAVAMQARSHTTAMVAAVLLCACALKTPPDAAQIRKEALPNTQIPEQWATEGASGTSIEQGWLAEFQDAQLNTLAEEALAFNADLRVASARLDQAASYVKAAGAKLYPSVDLLARGGGKLSGDSSGLQGVGITASWELDVWGRVRAGRAATQTQYASASADFEYARQSLVAAVAKSWFTATEAKMQRAIAQDTVRSAEQLAGFARDRERVGRGDAFEVASAQASLETYRDTLRQLDLAYAQSVRALEVLLGRYPAALLQTPEQLPAMPPAVPVGLPSELLERRPDVIASERRVAAAFNRIQEAKAARLPRISLTAGLNTISSELFVLQDRDNPMFSAGASLVAPLFQGGALQAQVELRTAEQRQAVAQYASVALGAFAEVESALSSEFALRDREAILNRAVAESGRALGLVNVRYEVGSSDLRSVQQQQLASYAARASLLRVQSEARVQRVNVHLALGGGFGGPNAQLRDRMSVDTEGATSVVNIYRVVGAGAAEIRSPAGGWPAAVKIRLHGFRGLRSVQARASGQTLECKPEGNRFMSESYECKYTGPGGESPRAEGDYVEVQLPRTLLTADGSPVEVHWSEHGL
jgi:NodT family efflux transporter outer membrane factor (OMF) lipoprotein